MRLRLAGLAILALGIVCPPGAAQHPSSTMEADDYGAEVRVETHDGRTQFSLDEPITLDLVFTSREH
jgi:hypothetical protein